MLNIITDSGYGQKGNKIISLYVQKREIDIIVGGNLKRLRQSSALTQEGLADKLGITSTGLVPQWESGLKGIGKNVLEKLCVVFNVRPYEFYLETETPIIQDKSEKEILNIYREAKELGGAVAEKIPQYARFIITETKKPEKKPAAKSRSTRSKADKK